MSESFTSEYVSHHRRVADALQKENEDLSGENIRLRRCLLLLQENAELKTVTAMTTVLSSGDRKLRDFLTDAILNHGTKNSTANHFRPISTSPYQIARENTSPVVSKIPSSRVTSNINSSGYKGRFSGDNINQYETESGLVPIPFRDYDTSSLRTQLYQSDIPKDTDESPSDQEHPTKSVSPRGNRLSERMERRKYMMPSPNRESATPEVEKLFSRSPTGPKSYAWRKQTSSPVKNLLTGKMSLRKSVSPGSGSPRKLTKIRELSPARELFESNPNTDKRKYISTADDMFVNRGNVIYDAPTTLRPTDMSAAEGVQHTGTVFNKVYLSGRKSVPPNIDIFTDRMERVKSYSPSPFMPVARLSPRSPTRPTIIPQYDDRKMTSMQRNFHSPSEGFYYRSYLNKISPRTLQETDLKGNALTPYNQDFQRKEGTVADTLSYNQHDVAEINSQSMKGDIMKSNSVTSTGDKEQESQRVGSTRQQSPSSRYCGDQGPSTQSTIESEGYVTQLVHDASQSQGGYYDAVGNPVAASTPIRPASTQLNKHIGNPGIFL
ncbi:hypothetical protein CHS0354_031024 [Potamilus streckersoni]|uniref:Uncharacterized protein n=1 Tax=Potamilus streckersoni TaxID=2493646 RepID=A0AAE0WAF1_9BIVA|nr:hypothetical protein CHS0354_031024 [Potamilus streckersoni]